MNSDLISIITPVYNGERYLRECLESVKSISEVNFEHIVVDDGSTDGTLDILSAYKDIKVISISRRGANIARNIGFRESNGNYIKFLDSDDILEPQSIIKQLKFSKECDSKAISYGYAQKFDDLGFSAEMFRDQSLDMHANYVGLILNNIQTSLSLYPRLALEAVNGFDESLKARQEWNLNLRLSKLGYSFIFDNVKVCRIRIHNSIERISNRKFVLEDELDGVFKTFNSLKNYATEDDNDAFATYLFMLGVNFIKCGDEDSAIKIFKISRNISPLGFCRYLVWYKKLIYRFISPIWVHRLIGKNNFN